MDCEKVANHIQEWMRKQVDSARVSGVIVGISGGIDSAVVAALCKREFDDKITGVIVPCESLADDAIDAQILAKTFAIDCKVSNITDAYVAMLNCFPETFDCKLARSNLKSRLRMSTLYYYANNMNCVVMGTTNRTEASIGYFTKYGDGGVDFEPIADLLKREVRELANYLGVPERIIIKPPSAGLWEGQTDEDEIGLTYDMMDNILIGKREQPNSFYQLRKKCLHKGEVPPMCSMEDCEGFQE